MSVIVDEKRQKIWEILAIKEKVDQKAILLYHRTRVLLNHCGGKHD